MRRISAQRDGLNYEAIRPTDDGVARARELRQESTPPEQVVWNILRREGRRLGVVFRRQHPLGPYVADFYCTTAGPVVEIDGSMHAHRGAADAQRNEWMQAQGIEVVRVRGDEVCRDAKAVCASVLARARVLKASREARREC
ncbi:MAG: DUF559 domain-containing protein [Phycisphaerales bacterium]|nr:DUF559 domain-containing protein [Phycisphaerales bacterium]